MVVGDGPSDASPRTALPGAVFLGRRTGDDLARLFASLGMFVHTGPHETFCQTVQEAMASGVPVIAPAAGGPLDRSTTGGPGCWSRRSTPVPWRRQSPHSPRTPRSRRSGLESARRAGPGRDSEVRT
ncbi:hypothetical protein GCM10010207_72070 [Streptomyces atratus]|nr:hypothetical protein GCM10010207_72070 [Streptomyces atratus]